MRSLLMFDNTGKSAQMVILSRREVQVVRLLLSGLPMKHIAHRMKISPGTLRSHLQNISDRLEQADGSHLETRALICQWAYSYPHVLQGCAVSPLLHASECLCGAPYCATQSIKDARAAA